MANILITGANRGIGLALTLQLLERGHRVHVGCRKSSKTLDQLGCEVYEGLDVRNFETVQALRQRMKGISIDWLINNAGIFCEDDLGNMNWESIEMQWQVNALGPLRMVESFNDLLSSGGKVMMISSQMGSICDNKSGGYYGYRMSKAALNMASASLALDLKAREISVGVYHPGYVQTDMTKHQGHITPEVSARGLVLLFENLSLKDSGGFWNYNGTQLPW